MEDILMDKKYYWKMNGYIYEVTKEQYYRYRKEQDRHDYLREAEEEAVILSLNSLGGEGRDGVNFIADPNVNVEDDVIHKIMLDKLRWALDKLSAEELFLIDMLYTQMKSEREIASELGVSQNAVNKKKKKLLGQLKKFLEK